jgi:hypothetical protein
MNKTKNTKNRLAKFVKPMALGGALMLLSQSPFVFASDSQEVPDKVDINIQTICPDITDLPLDKKNMTGFSHRDHAEKYLPGNSEFAAHPYKDEFTCGACHSGIANEKEMSEGKVCDRLSKAIEEGGGGKNYKKYMHGICLTCHKNMKAAEKKTGPTSCKDCHPKKEQ